MNRHVDEHYEWLRRVALELTRDPHAADDLVQETLLATVTNPPERGGVRAWLRATLRNVHRHQRRSSHARRRRETASARPDAIDAPQDDLGELRSAVQDTIASLPSELRETVRLRFFEELSIREIASRTGRPFETERARLQRGIQFLRNRLQAYYGLTGVGILQGIETARGGGLGAAAASPGTVSTLVLNPKVVVPLLVLFAAGIVSLRFFGDARPTTPVVDPLTVGSARPAPLVSESDVHRGVPVAGASPVVTAPVRDADPADSVTGVVRGDHGRPIVGAVVVAIVPRVEGRRLRWTVIAESTTDQDGHFRLKAKATQFVVEARAEGCARERRSAIRGDRIDFTLGPAGAMVVRVVGPNGPCSGMVSIRPCPPGVDESQVTIPPYDRLSEVWCPLGEGGEARFEDLAPGDYVVIARPEGLASRLAPRERVRVARVSRVVLSCGPASSVVVELFDAATGEVIVGADVTNVDSGATLRTDARGRIRLSGLIPSEGVALCLAHPDYHAAELVMTRKQLLVSSVFRVSMTRGVPVQCELVDRGRRVADAVITIASWRGYRATSDDEGRFVLSPVVERFPVLVRRRGGDVFERVVRVRRSDAGKPIRIECPRMVTVQGTIRTSGGAPAECDVVAESAATRTALAITRTDSRGRFRLEGVPVGARCFVVPRDGTIEEIPIPRGVDPVHSVQHVLAEATWIRGIVVDDADTPVSDATVRLWVVRGPSIDAQIGFGRPFRRVVRTDAFGRFSIRSVSRIEPQRIRAFGDGFLASSVDVATTAEVLTLRVQRVGILAATFANDGARAGSVGRGLAYPIDGDGPSRAKVFRSLANGVTWRLPAGTYRVKFICEDASTATLDVVVKAGRTTKREFLLGPNGTLRLLVQSTDSFDSEWLQCVVYRMDNRRFRPPASGVISRGTTSTSMMPDVYLIRVLDPERPWRRAECMVRVRGRVVTPVTVRLRRATQLRVVVTVGGEPVRVQRVVARRRGVVWPWEVTLRDVKGAESYLARWAAKQAAWNEDGDYFLPSGEYRIEVQTTEGTFQRDVTVGDDAEQTVTIEVE